MAWRPAKHSETPTLQKRSIRDFHGSASGNKRQVCAKGHHAGQVYRARYISDRGPPYVGRQIEDINASVHRFEILQLSLPRRMRTRRATAETGHPWTIRPGVISSMSDCGGLHHRFRSHQFPSEHFRRTPSPDRYFYFFASGFSKIAAFPSSCSISRSRLYLQIRSLRQAEPVLIWPPPIATAKSARNVSSVSPER